MEIIETFGHYVENLTDKKPQSARRLLKTGWEAQNLKFRYMQDKRLMPADRHLANLMMDTMLRPIQKPEDSVIVSIFTPCEMMQEVGLHPYNVEGFSCYLSASKAERAFLQQAENQGIAETLCSYHKTFLGAAQKGLLPKPKCIVYTNLTCDGPDRGTCRCSTGSGPVGRRLLHCSPSVPWQIFTRYLYLPLMYHGIRPQRMYSMWQIS